MHFTKLLYHINIIFKQLSRDTVIKNNKKKTNMTTVFFAFVNARKGKINLRFLQKLARLARISVI